MIQSAIDKLRSKSNLKEEDAAPARSGDAAPSGKENAVPANKRRIPSASRARKRNCGLHVPPPPPDHPPRLWHGMPTGLHGSFVQQIKNITEKAVHDFVTRQNIPKSEIVTFLRNERSRGQARTATVSFVDWDLRLHLKFLLQFTTTLCTETDSAFYGHKPAAPADVIKAAKEVADQRLGHDRVRGTFDDADLLVFWSAFTNLVELVGGDRDALRQLFKEIIRATALPMDATEDGPTAK